MTLTSEPKLINKLSSSEHIGVLFLKFCGSTWQKIQIMAQTKLHATMTFDLKIKSFTSCG